jgi:CubicO group peptidase (beta-lactamase class C family)
VPTNPSRTPRIDPARLDRALARLGERLAERGIAPAAVAVATGSDGVVGSRVFGDGVTTDSVFPIASITKPMVATVVLQVVEDGGLSISQTLRSYIPEFAPQPHAEGLPGAETITLWHLLTHTSGVEDVRAAWADRARIGREEVYRMMTSGRLAYAPGTRYVYASDTFYLLAEAVVRSLGRPFAEVLRDQLFEPLGMGSTSFDPRPFGDRFVSLRGLVSDAQAREAVGAFVALEHPGGGLVSTVGDVARFGLAMLAGGRLGGTRLLGRPFVEFMTREHTQGIREEGMPPRDPQYGLGWARMGRQRPSSSGAFGHGGATGSLFVVDPTYDVVFVFLRNEWDADGEPEEIALQLVYGAFED